MTFILSKGIPTSDANNNRRFSPPDKPLMRPGRPMTVFSAFFRLSYEDKKNYGSFSLAVFLQHQALLQHASDALLLSLHEEFVTWPETI